MTLPIIPTPEFKIKKSAFVKTPITLRPFLVGEETILLKVKDSEDPQEIMDAIKQVVNRCIVSPEGMKAEHLPTFVLELIFLRLRQHSNGEIVDLEYRCKNDVEGVTCDHEFEVKLDLREADIVAHEGHTHLFEVGGGIGIALKYPTLEMAQELGDNDDWLDTITASIESVYQGDDVWMAADYKPEELRKFAKGINGKVKKEINEKFFKLIPSVQSKIQAPCPKCGHVHKITLTGMEDHFG